MREHGATVSDMDSLCASADLDAHERGEVDGERFLDRLSALSPARPPRARLKSRWNHMYRPVAAMFMLVRACAHRHRVYLLSNMGDLHLAHLSQAFGLATLAHDAIFSCEVGAMKPDPRIYVAAERRFGLQAPNTVFIDDRSANVAAARDRGWLGILHQGPKQTRAALARLGVRT
jgi:HAD superfamily hydrolase (TIGR01509 family)